MVSIRWMSLSSCWEVGELLATGEKDVGDTRGDVLFGTSIRAIL